MASGLWARAPNNLSLNWFHDHLLHAQANAPRQRIDLRVFCSNSPEGLPAGWSGEKLEGLILQGVEPANEGKGWLAADHLAEQGHRTVAMVSADPQFSAATRRVVAFRQRSRELGLKVHSILGRPNPAVSYLELMPAHEESETLVGTLLAATPRDT